MKLNYFNFKKFKNRYLLTNEQGFYSFLDVEDLKKLVQENYMDISAEILCELKQKFFVYDEDEAVFVEKASFPYRDNKNYVFDATCLHIFVVTNACNMCCVYCQAQDSEQLHKGMMDRDTVEQAIEIALQAPNRNLTFEFQGGEPLINFPVIKHAVEYTEANKNDKNISYTIVTNTLLLTDEMIEFFGKYHVAVSTSLDGGQEVHDANRPQKQNGSGTYDIVCRNIQRLRAHNVGVGAIQTTTRKSLHDPKAIVKAYRDLGLGYLFLRPLTPLGYAKEHWNEIGYTAEEFLEFYRRALAEIIQCNREGFCISEGHAAIFLRKIIGHEADNYMELRSPCGAGIGQMAYYYDGNVYTCDEGRMLAEMGMPDFKLGTVQSTYDELMDSHVCKVTCQASVLEGIPQCCDCVYHAYCGVCPVVNFAMEKNIYARSANGYKCAIYKGIIDTLFEYLYLDNDVMEIFETWL